MLKKALCFPKEYPKRTEVLFSALFAAHQLLISEKTSSWGVHLKAGIPNVHSVINVLHFTSSKGSAMPSFSVLKSPVNTHTSPLYSTLTCEDATICPAG